MNLRQKIYLEDITSKICCFFCACATYPSGRVCEENSDKIQKKFKKCDKVKLFNQNFYVYLFINISVTTVINNSLILNGKKWKFWQKIILLPQFSPRHEVKNQNKQTKLVKHAVILKKYCQFLIKQINVNHEASVCLIVTISCGFISVHFLSHSRYRNKRDDVHNQLLVQPGYLQYNVKGDVRKRSEVMFILIKKCGDVETNPGPLDISPVNKQNLIVTSYNVQGLNNIHKVKRLFNKLNKLEFKNNCIINLQETHLTGGNVFKYHWKGDYVASKGTRASCGVAILFNPNYFDAIISKKVDENGRFCSLTASKNLEVFHFINIYAPNNHYESCNFFNSLIPHLDDVLSQHPLANLVISGDFNVVFDPKVDSIGRNQSRQETKVIKIFNQIKTLHNLIDSYRSIHKFGGFTWKRNNPTYLRSRLDHVFVSKNLSQKLISCSVSYSLDESDHSLVLSEFDIGNVRYGPGIIRCNATILDDEVTRMKIIDNVNAKMSEDTGNYNPHEKLDYFKYLLRAEILKEGKLKSKVEKSRLEISNNEVSILKAKLDKLLLERHNGNTQNDSDIESVKIAIEIAEEPINELKLNESKKLIFRSKAKWAEEGEKSTKYFLNLLKYRQNKMILRKITANGQTFHKQDEISKAIENFYKKLYAKQPELKPLQDDSTLFSDMPQLDEIDREMLSQVINLDELRPL
jgi:exonuclease III